MTPERLELFHAPRNPLHYGLAGFCLMGFLSIPTQCIEKYIAPEPPPAVRQAQPSPAPLYSKRCLARDREMLAHQRDGGQWEIHCVPRGELVWL